MKISLALGQREGLSRQTAMGCLTTNLALPGFGSLVAGRRSGYPQVILCLVGLFLTTVFGVRFVAWSINNWTQLHQQSDDPFTSLAEMWLMVRWPLLGIGIFAVSWLWALATSFEILHSAKRESSSRVPPKL